MGAAVAVVVAACGLGGCGVAGCAAAVGGLVVGLIRCGELVGISDGGTLVAGG
jgi:hypothetical protein